MTEYEQSLIDIATGIQSQLQEVTIRLGRIVDKLGHQIAKSDQLIASQTVIAQEIEGLKDLHAASLAMSHELVEEAKTKMAAQEEEVAAARSAITAPVPVDVYPFESLPAGTESRALPDGGKLFTLSDGAALRISPMGEMMAIMPDGQSLPLEMARDRTVVLPDGRSLRLHQDAVRATHEAVGVSGIPVDVEPEEVAPGRYRILLSGNYRLEVSHPESRLVVINPTGTILVLTPTKLDAIGEPLSVRPIAGGARAFHTGESNNRGVVEEDGTIHLTLPNGRDLTVRFPAPQTTPVDVASPRTFTCQRRFQ